MLSCAPAATWWACTGVVLRSTALVAMDRAEPATLAATRRGVESRESMVQEESRVSR